MSNVLPSLSSEQDVRRAAPDLVGTTRPQPSREPADSLAPWPKIHFLSADLPRSTSKRFSSRVEASPTSSL